MFTREMLGSFDREFVGDTYPTRPFFDPKLIDNLVTTKVTKKRFGEKRLTPLGVFDGAWTWLDTDEKELPMKHKKVIFNDPATIVIWEDGTRTVVKTCEGDTFDKTTGFLQAYFQKVSGMNKTQANKFLRSIVED